MLSFLLFPHFYGINISPVTVNEIAPIFSPSKKDNYILFRFIKTLFLTNCLSFNILPFTFYFSYIFIFNFLKIKVLCYKYIAIYSLLKGQWERRGCGQSLPGVGNKIKLKRVQFWQERGGGMNLGDWPRDCQQITFEFLNRICLLKSSLAPSPLNRKIHFNTNTITAFQSC